MIRFRYYIFIVLAMSASLLAEKDIILEISLLPTADEHFSLIDDYVKQSFMVQKISYQSDISFEQSEFAYLTNFKEQSLITNTMLKQACWHIRRKNKFESIIFTFKSHAGAIELNCELKAFWTFSKVIFKGSLVGKDRYVQYYSLEPGDIFDLSQHQRSLTYILQELKNQGYLNARIIDHVVYDKDLKRAIVTLYLEKTERFTVSETPILITVDTQNCPEQCKNIQIRIKNLLERNLVGQYYTKESIDQHCEQIKAYLMRKGFLNPTILFEPIIDYDKHQIELAFSITLYQKKRFVFFGNHFFSTSQLFNELLMVGSSAFLIPPELLAQDIKVLYKKKGYWFTQVQWREEADKFYFVIKEGARIRVSHVELKGSNFLKSSVLIKKVFSDFYKQTYFSADILKRALDDLAQEYIKEGFWDFNIVKQEFGHSDTNNTYDLIITVHEGARRMLSGIVIQDHPELLDQGPFIVYKKNALPCPLDPQIVQHMRQWLITYFQEKGFMYVSVKPEFVEQALSDKIEHIALIWHVLYETGKLHFGKTVLAGAAKIPSSVILREIRYKVGDIWNREKVDQTLKGLKSLNMFESVSLVPHNWVQPESSKALMLKVIEHDPFEIRTRFGFQQVSKSFTHLAGTTYIVGGSFLWRNPRGIADVIRLDADITRYTRDLAFTYQVPWLFNKPIRTTFKAYTAQYIQPFRTSAHERLYTESHDGFLAIFNPTRIGQINDAKIICGIESMKISGYCKDLASIIDFEPALVDKRIPAVYIEPSIIIDRLDNPLSPTRGSFTLLSARAVLPFSIKQGYFVRCLFEQSLVCPLYRSIIGAVRFRLGHIFNTHFSTILPTERFYLGGATSLRGYETDMVPPLNSYVNSKGERCWVPIGGKTMMNVNAELRFGIYKDLSGVIFNDMGVLTQKSWSDIAGNNWVGATGFGVRYATPIGPLRFDIGWKWKKRTPQDKSYAWFITLGHAF